MVISGIILLGIGGIFLMDSSEKFEVQKKEVIEKEINAVAKDEKTDEVISEMPIQQEALSEKVPEIYPEKRVSKDTTLSGEKELLPKIHDSPSSANVTKKIVSWGFEKMENRTVDTVILHSSYNPLEGEKYDVDAVIGIYKTYGVSPHYIIDRGGKIIQLVEEKNSAYHAGVSALPDGRTNVNAVSIGIEILNDDKGDGYTEAQYHSINALLADIQRRYALRYLLGHKDIAPGRKTDPWNFQWNKIIFLK